MWFNKLSCNIGTVPTCSSSASYLQFRYSSEASTVVLSSVTHFVHLNFAKFGERVGLANYLQQTLILDILDSRLFRRSKKLFFTNLQGVVYTYEFKLTIFHWLDKMSHVHVFFSAIGLVPPEQGSVNWQLFPQMLPDSLLPLFSRREAGDEASCTVGMTGLQIRVGQVK